MIHVALLRGINVGGKNIIKMSALKATFEGLGFTDVRTYIASGNVLFATKERAGLTEKIEGALAEAFGETKVVVLSAKALADIVTRAPRGFGTKPDTYHSDVLFPKPPLRPATVMSELEIAEGIDEAHAGTHAVYFSRLSAKRTRSRLSKIVAKPVYKRLTIRSWSTTKKLHELVTATTNPKAAPTSKAVKTSRARGRAGQVS